MPKLSETPREPRSSGAPRPSTPDGIKTAMGLDAAADGSTNYQHEVFRKQAILIGWQAASERTNFALKALTILVGIAFGGAVLAIVLHAAQSKLVVVEAFDTPPSLAQRGLTGKAVAAGVQDTLSLIQARVRTTAQTRNISNAWTGVITVEVPRTGVSLGELDRMLRERISHETHISGTLIDNFDGTVALTVRGTGIEPKTFTGPIAGLPSLSQKAAEHVYGLYEPRLYVTYLSQNDRNAEALAFVPGAFSRAPRAVQAELAVLWGNLLRSEQGDLKGALSKANLGIRIDPYYWRAWTSRATVLLLLYGEESAWRADQQTLEAFRKAPREHQTLPQTWVNHEGRAGAWTDQIRRMRDDAQGTGRGTLSVRNTTAFAEAEAHRHDYAAANLELDLGDTNDPAIPPTQALIASLAALDRGRPADALGPIKTFDAAWKASKALQFQYNRAPCVVGLVYGLNGDEAGAEAAFARARLIAHAPPSAPTSSRPRANGRGPMRPIWRPRASSHRCRSSTSDGA